MARRTRTEEEKEKFRAYHREWERKTYALTPRKRTYTLEQKERRHQYYLKHRTRQIADINARRKANPQQRKKWDRKYCLSHTGYLREKARRWKALNPEKRKAIDKRCKTKNKAKYKITHAKWYARNRPRILALNGQNKERFRQWAANWRKLNPDKIKATRRAVTASGRAAEMAHRRRARLRAVTVENCSKIVSLLRLMPFCQYCFMPIKGKPTIDHVIPISRGGAHAKGNLVAACPSCNFSKNTKLPHEWTGRIITEEAA